MSLRHLAALCYAVGGVLFLLGGVPLIGAAALMLAVAQWTLPR